jgi:hypothetical protein
MIRQSHKLTTRDLKCPICGAPAGSMCHSVRADKPLPDDHALRRLISIREALALGHQRLRKPVWANKFDHLKIDIIDGQMGPWVHLYAPFNQECNGRDPVDMLAIGPLFPPEGMETPEFEIYDGPLPDSDAYKAEVARFVRQVEQTEAKS